MTKIEYLSFIIIQTPQKFYRSQTMVEKWIETDLLNVTKPADICIDNPIQMHQLPVYGTSDRYILLGIYPSGTYYPPHCRGSYIVTAPAIEILLKQFQQLKETI